jgi:hypothetical protein
MNTTSRLLITCATAFVALSANAGSAASMTDGSRITNGGTGFIGVTQSAGQPRMAQRFASMPAGEATTMVNGQPNANPDAPTWSAEVQRTAERSMGNSAGVRMDARAAAARNPAWGTPD